MKKTLSIILSVIIFSSFIITPVNTIAATGGDLGTGVYWSYNSETGQLNIYGKGEIPFFENQSSIPWWNYRNEITSVTIEDGITTVASLEKLSYLKEITLPDSVTVIEGSAFYDCGSLETVNLTKNITYISTHAFDKCKSLVNFTIDGDINGTGNPVSEENTSSNCYADSYYFVRDGVLFANSNYYTDISLSVKELNHNTLVKYPSGRTETEYSVPNDILEIGSDAFSSVKNLQTVIIPSSVISFYVRSFVGYGENYEQPLTLFFQYDSYPEDMARSALRNLCAGSRIFVKNETVKQAFEEKSTYFIYNSDKQVKVNIEVLNIPTTDLTITHSPDTLKNNETSCIEISRVPSNTTDNVIFSSSDESVVSVDEYGKITAKGMGTATVTVTSGSVSKQIEITVICGHTETHTENIVEATCSAPGYTGDKVCNECKATVESGLYIPELRHSYITSESKPETCTEQGCTGKVYCSVCSYVKSASEIIPAKGHEESDWIIDTTPSYTAPGIKHKECLNCGKVLEKIKYANRKKPQQPELSSLSPTSNGVKVTWKKTTGADSYIVYRKSYSGGIWSGWKNLGSTKSTSFTDNAVKSGEYYRYTVRAENSGGLSSYNTYGLKIKYLKMPWLRTIVSLKSGVQIKWDKSVGSSGYIVYRKTYSKGKWSGWQRVSTVKGVSTLSYTDKSAKKGVYYRYTVKAYSGNYYSSYDTYGLSITDRY